MNDIIFLLMLNLLLFTNLQHTVFIQCHTNISILSKNVGKLYYFTFENKLSGMPLTDKNLAFTFAKFTKFLLVCYTCFKIKLHCNALFFFWEKIESIKSSVVFVKNNPLSCKEVNICHAPDSHLYNWQNKEPIVFVWKILF